MNISKQWYNHFNMPKPYISLVLIVVLIFTIGMILILIFSTPNNQTIPAMPTASPFNPNHDQDRAAKSPSQSPETNKTSPQTSISTSLKPLYINSPSNLAIKDGNVILFDSAKKYQIVFDKETYQNDILADGEGYAKSSRFIFEKLEITPDKKMY